MIHKKRLLTSILMLCIFSLSVGAEVIKSEIVYAKLSAAGEPEQVFVVNAFELDEPAEALDYGKYSQVKALSEMDAFAFEGDTVSFKANSGRFFYEGIPEDLRLPWQINLKYMLNGEEISPQVVSGKSGQLQIVLDIAPVAGFEAYTDAMTLQLTLTLDGDRSYGVTSEKATMAWAGGNLALNFVVLPGQSAVYTVNTDVRNFSMPALQAAGVKMAMDTQMYKELASKALAGSPLETAVGGLMENFLKAMQGGSSPSFMDERNQIDSLQFVMMIEGIPQAEQAKAETQMDERVKTIWDQLLNLFGL